MTMQKTNRRMSRAIVVTAIVLGSIIVLCLMAGAIYGYMVDRYYRYGPFSSPNSLWVSKQGDISLVIDESRYGKLQIDQSGVVTEYSMMGWFKTAIRVGTPKVTDTENSSDKPEEVWSGFMLNRRVLLLRVATDGVVSEERIITLYRQD